MWHRLGGEDDPVITKRALARVLGGKVILAGLALAAGCGSEAPDPEHDRSASDIQGEAAQVGAPNAPQPGPVAQVEQALTGPDRPRRLQTAWSLPDRTDVDPTTQARMLLEAVEEEIADPDTGRPPEGTYLSATEWARYVYTLALGRLDPAGLEVVRQTAGDATGELAERATLALAYAGDSTAVPGLVILLETSGTGDVRSDAAYLLGELGAVEAIPALRRAAENDPYVARTERLGGGWTEIYPVKTAAMRSLEQLGLSVELGEDGQYRLIDPS